MTARARTRNTVTKAKASRRAKQSPRPPRRPRAHSRTPASDGALRKLLIAQLEGGHAHATLAQALDGFPAERRGVRPDGVAHSAWQVLEHLRLAQWDIVEFSRDPAHRSPAWPAGYWPAETEPPSVSAWDESVRAFERELEVMKRLVRDPKRPLHARVDHPEAKAHHTLAREAMVLAIHNGYHIAELILLRRLLGAWKD